MPARVLALRSELCNAALASPSKMAAAFDRVRERMFSSAPLPMSGSRHTSTGHTQRAKHASDRIEEAKIPARPPTATQEKPTRPLISGMRRQRQRSPLKSPKLEQGVMQHSSPNSAPVSSRAESAVRALHWESSTAQHHSCADQITDSDQESASTCPSVTTSESDFEGDASQWQQTASASSQSVPYADASKQGCKQQCCVENLRLADLSAADNLRGSESSNSSNAVPHVRKRDNLLPRFRATSKWCQTLRSIMTMLVCLTVLELGVRGAQRYSLLDTVAAAAGIPLAAGSLFQRNAPHDRVLYPRQPLAVQMPADSNDPISPQAVANEIRMKLVPGGSAEEYRVLLDVSSVQAMLIRRGQARLCLTVHKQQSGPAPPLGNRGGVLRGGLARPGAGASRTPWPTSHLPRAAPTQAARRLCWIGRQRTRHHCRAAS